TSFIHSIHAASKRTVPYNWHASSATDGFFNVGYPGVLSQCTACHLPGTFDLSAPTSAAALDNRLFRTVATGTLAASLTNSPYISLGVNYGSGYSNTAAGVPTDAAPTTLVTSPTTTACFACHDSSDDISHFKLNGGAVYQPRSVALTSTNETCMICHGSGRIADIAVVHNK
ncbi:MAG: hypothetical protein ABIZ18_12035, partial [Caldimonas sp.]